MMQLGNLAIVASKYKECSLQIYNGQVTLFTGGPTERRSFTCDVRDDHYINRLIAFLNFGTEVEEDNQKAIENYKKGKADG